MEHISEPVERVLGTLDSQMKMMQLLEALRVLGWQVPGTDDHEYHEDLYREYLTTFWPDLTPADKQRVRDARARTKPDPKPELPYRIMPNPSMVVEASA
jgi:hypothetical protein